MADLRAQAAPVRRWLIKAVALLFLLILADRLLGLILIGGLDRYYGLNTPAAVLCVGHSHTVLGIDRVSLERALGVPVAKFAVEGANTADRLEMIRYYFRRQPAAVKAVVYDVDAHTFTSAGLSSASYQLLYPFIGDPEIRAYVRRHCSSASEYWVRRLVCLTRYNELTIWLSLRGYLRKWDNLKFGQVDVPRLQEAVRQGRFRKIAFDADNLALFQKTAGFVSAQGGTLFLLYVPTIDVVNRAEPEKFASSMFIFRDFSATNANVVFLDYNHEFESQHELFFDPIHLNPQGQAAVTQRLGRDLSSWFRSARTAHADRASATSRRALAFAAPNGR